MSSESKKDETMASHGKARKMSLDQTASDELAPQISRRAVLGGLGAAAAFAAMPTSRAAFASGGSASDATPVIGAREAFEKLKAGNERYISHHPRGEQGLPERRKKLAGGQQPFATILSCSDSRVPPELVFDQSLGDIFIIRMAGNIIDTDVLGSIEYAVLHLKTPLLYVLGHQKCGAVDAALAEMQGQAHEPENITALLRKITPGLKGVDLKLPKDQLLQAAVEANVQWTVKQLRETPELKRELDSKKLALVSGIYELASGNIQILEQSITA
jgi:carbonic anhydrase